MKRFFPDGSLWVSAEARIEAIDQRFLPFRRVVFAMESPGEVFYAIREMVVRGAPLIGVAAAFGVYLGVYGCPGQDCVRCAEETARYLEGSRPTAVNLFKATRRMVRCLDPSLSREENLGRLFREACRTREEETEACRRIGENGLPLIEALAARKQGRPVEILTHCNAGWLACVKWGTALAPVYLAHEKGIPLHVWVDETRPRNQGARLTAWELGLAGIPHTVIPDNAGGHLMQHGRVDLVIVGSDRTTLNGDVANKTGTYLKALAARDNNLPFYAALPVSTIDPGLEVGVRNIPVEERDQEEVAFAEGWDGRKLRRVRLTPSASPAANYAFDVTPARLVTGLITEKGLCRADRQSIATLLSE